MNYFRKRSYIRTGCESHKSTDKAHGNKKIALGKLNDIIIMRLIFIEIIWELFHFIFVKEAGLFISEDVVRD